MTTADICPDPVTLNQLLDDELPAAAGTPVRDHVAGCPGCRSRVATLERAADAGRATVHRVPADRPAPGDDCLSDARLAGWAANALAGDELQRAEAHLDRCDPCLTAARAAIATSRTLAREGLAAPASLAARVASRWPERSPGMARLVVEVGRRSLRFLEQHLAAPLVAIEPQLVPLPTQRADDAPGAALSVRLRGEDAEIQATLVPEDGLVGVTVLLLGQEGAPLRGQRLHVRQHGASVFSARTDANGELRLPRLEAGDYDVVCPGIATTFRLELRG